MAIKTLYAAESWDKVYDAFKQINFSAYDYDTVKESLLQYLKLYYAESFNDFIESSSLIAILELFAYVAEQLSYRIDTAAHENFITTAQRKQSILRLAKLISYTASRNVPARGLVKITSISTSNQIFDSLGNNLANIIITWNDPNNTNWKEQFILVLNDVITSTFGKPNKISQVGDVVLQVYTLNNQLNAFKNGVFGFSASGQNEQLQMEVVPVDIDDNGPFERAPDVNAQFNIVYANDGKGDGSDYTGFMMFVKQGSLSKIDYTIQTPVVNRRLELNNININDTDVWVYGVDDTGTITDIWTHVNTLLEQNLQFNDQVGRKKYEIETLENDSIALIFGDGNFSDIPVGNMQIWTRTSVNQVVFIPKNRILDQQLSFTYLNNQNNSNTCNITFSLTAPLQNNAPSETLEQIRQAAPATYYAQNRMVNGQDYNTFPLQDPTILKLKTINRTFAGQPKYINWNDASGKYENIKLFGDDLILYSNISAESSTSSSPKNIIDNIIEPLLQSKGVFGSLIHAINSFPNADGIVTYPRKFFIEDNRLLYFNLDGTVIAPYGQQSDGTWVQSTLTNGGDGSLNEKTAIQSAIDSHWYGDPLGYVLINGIRHGLIPDPTLNPQSDSKLYQSDLPRTIDGVNTYPPGDVGSGLQQVPSQNIFGLKYNPFIKAFGSGDITLYNNFGDHGIVGSNNGKTVVVQSLSKFNTKKETITLEMMSDGVTFKVTSNLRGALPNYIVSTGGMWSMQVTQTNLPCDFIITQFSQFQAGDAFVIDITYNAQTQTSTANVRVFYTDTLLNNTYLVNLTGWWQIIPSEVMHLASVNNSGPTLQQQMTFDTTVQANSWIYLVTANGTSSNMSWTVYNRDFKIVAESPTTNFWYNNTDQIIDPETQNPVLDKIRILRSNLDESGYPLQSSQIYDVLGVVTDTVGTPNYNQLEIIPEDTLLFDRSSNTAINNVLQFEVFSQNSYQYGVLQSDGVTINWLDCSTTDMSFKIADGYDYNPKNYDISAYDNTVLIIVLASGNTIYRFTPGDFVATPDPDIVNPYIIVRRKMSPAPFDITNFECNSTKGLDFMWQHFSPSTNLIDPSVSNIHDAFILTRGYYTSVQNYITGNSSILPIPPSSFDLRNSYGYLLENKMLSDTVVMFPGKIKLLFGQLADQQFRASFKVVKDPNASFSDERIKDEVISVINTFFNIKNWDFGDTFYATKLISLIHQRLADQISSVVIVPTYSVNSFGSLFTIESGTDEVFQSAATSDDVEIVDALTATVLKQIK